MPYTSAMRAHIFYKRNMGLYNKTRDKGSQINDKHNISHAMSFTRTWSSTYNKKTTTMLNHVLETKE